ncbi:MAG: hypothetical protein K2Q23_01850 [Bryobacteraceae bacterium]|nr:hypothetical protein [Bryobacteraceae bacterium]
MIEAWRELSRAFPWLAASTIYTALLLLPSLGLLLLDTRLVVGANPWLKPVKFELSIVLFNLTIGWMLLRLALPPLSARTISGIVALAMFVEISAIVIQAARGVPSHYNVSSKLNAAIFIAMAVAIVLNTLAIAWLGALCFWPQPQMAPAVVWGIRLGLTLFLLSSLEGFQIVGNKGHTVGARDGGPGLPLLRWSTTAGDLRVAHFIGIHGIQILPILGYLASRADRQAGTGFVAAAFAVLIGLFCWTLRQAWAGRPLIR